MRFLAAILARLAFAWGFLMPLPRRPHPRAPKEEPQHYYEGPDLTPAQRAHVLDALRSYIRGGSENLRQEVIALFETATLIPMPMKARMDWAAAEAEAAATGRSVADMIWDEAKMPDQVWYPKAERRKRGDDDRPA